MCGHTSQKSDPQNIGQATQISLPVKLQGAPCFHSPGPMFKFSVSENLHLPQRSLELSACCGCSCQHFMFTSAS